MKYGIAKHHVTFEGAGNFTPGEVIPASVIAAAKKDELDRLARLKAVEIKDDGKTDPDLMEAAKKDAQQLAAEEKARVEAIAEKPAENAADDDREGTIEEDAYEEAVEELEPMELDDDTIIEPETEDTTPATEPAAEEGTPAQEAAPRRKTRGRRT